MKCPHCKSEIKEGYRFCPNCRGRVNSNQVDEKLTDAPTANGTSESIMKGQDVSINARIHGIESTKENIVKGKAIFCISQGEVARKITESEFAQLDTLRGFIIEDGLCAAISINGELSEVEGGAYNLVSPHDVQRELEYSNRYGNKPGFVERIKRFWESIKNFVTNKRKDSDSAAEREAKIDKIVCNLTRDTVVSLYLRCERNFNIIVGGTPSADGSGKFQPLRVRTKYLDIDMGVSLTMRITDSRAFFAGYMQGRNSVSYWHIQQQLAPYVNSILQEEMRDCVVENARIDEAVKNRIISRLEQLSSELNGISVVGVIDITCDSEDMKRFRDISREFYLSDHELDYLQRSNEMKNRMAETVNSQKLNEARNAFELRVTLDKLNMDGLLHEDEMQQFTERLAQQKMEREASIETLRIEQLATLAMKKTDVEKSLLHHQMTTDAQTDELKFELYRKNNARELEKLYFEQALYGKQYLISKQRLEDTWQSEDYALARERKNRILEADTDTELLRKRVEQENISDDHALHQSQRKVDFEFDNTRRQVDFDFENTRRNQEMELEMERKKREMEMEKLQHDQQMSMQNMQAMLAMDLQISDNDHRHKMETENAQRDFELGKEQMRHEEQMQKDNLEYQLGMQKADSYTHMGADQIAASQLSDLTEAQSAAFSETFSSRKDAQTKEQMLQFANDSHQQNRQDMQNMMNQNRQDMQGMMSMMMQGMQNMANMNMQNVQNVANMNMNTQQNMMQMRQSAMQQQIDDTKQMKEEYREQAYHQQERTDQNQQQALNFTAMVHKGKEASGTTNNAAPKEEQNKEEKK